MHNLLAGLLLCVAAAAQGQHNILVVVADDLGVDYVGCYQEGTNPPPTPTLDALAQRGVLFRNAWANPSCSPTRACIQTGRYPFRTLVGRWIAHTQSPQNVGLLKVQEETIPEILDRAQSGYAHALIGKWHLHDAFTPADCPRTIGGYSHFAGSLEGQIPSYTNWTRVVDGQSAVTSAYCTTQNTDDALAWIQAQTGPWVCVLTYQAPHIPYHAPPAHLHTQNLAGLTPIASHNVANIPFYRAMVQSLDTEMGRLFATLGPSVVDATNIVFIADNGSVQQQSVAPFSGTRSKGTPYEGGVNVPLIVAGPAVQQPGREVTALACAVDVYKTVLDLAGAAHAVSPWIQTDSVSLVPYLQNPQQAPLRQFAYTEEFTGTAWPAPMGNGHATIRDGRFKLIRRYSGAADELFDLNADPWETVNLRTSANPVVQAAYQALLAEISRLRTPPPVGSVFSAFGANTCQGSLGIPAVSGQGDSSLGGSFAFTVAGAPPFAPMIQATGFSATVWQGVPLPLALAPLLGTGPLCMLSSSAELLTFQAANAVGSAARLLPVPNDNALVGASVFSAWLVVDPAAPNSPGGLVSTQSVATVIAP